MSLSGLLGRTSFRSSGMDHPKAFLTLGIVFIASGTTFLMVGLLTHMLALWAIGPSLAGVGIAFLAVFKSRSARANSRGPISHPGSGA